MKHTITFETLSQAAIFELEMKGQISDGMWENTPGSSWRTWCDAEVRVSDNEDELGRDFYVSRNLGFGSKTLFEIVGDRMTHYARCAMVCDRVFPDATLKEKLDLAGLLEDCLWADDEKPSWKGLPKWMRDSMARNEGYAKIIMPLWEKLTEPGTVKILEAACEVFAAYSEDDAAKDTKRISKIAKREV